MLFIVTILFILFVCIRLSVTTHYFKYYVGEQVVPWLSSISNVLFRGINPILKFINIPVSWFGGHIAPLSPLSTDHVYGFEVLASIFNSIGQALSLVGVVAVPWFARVFGRIKAVIILFIAAMFFTGSFFFLKPENVTLILIFQIFGSITGGPISALLWVLYADTADYSEWKSGRRATGLVFSASIMSNKIGWAVGSAIAAVILDLTGYVKDMPQNENVREGLKSMMSIIPVAFGVIALIIIIFFYKLDEPLMKKIKAELEERRKQAGDNATTS